MFQNILLCVDGSKAAQKAVQWAVQAATAAKDMNVTIQYVQAPYLVFESYEYRTFWENEPIMPTSLNEVNPATEAARLFPDQKRVRLRAEIGIPTQAILDELATNRYDAVVLGAEGHGAVSSVLMGSVSAKVLHHAPCSVVIIR